MYVSGIMMIVKDAGTASPMSSQLILCLFRIINVPTITKKTPVAQERTLEKNEGEED